VKPGLKEGLEEMNLKTKFIKKSLKAEFKWNIEVIK
jgi:hypothetical protein